MTRNEITIEIHRHDEMRFYPASIKVHNWKHFIYELQINESARNLRKNVISLRLCRIFGADSDLGVQRDHVDADVDILIWFTSNSVVWLLIVRILRATLWNVKLPWKTHNFWWHFFFARAIVSTLIMEIERRHIIWHKWMSQCESEPSKQLNTLSPYEIADLLFGTVLCFAEPNVCTRLHANL